MWGRENSQLNTGKVVVKDKKKNLIVVDFDLSLSNFQRPNLNCCKNSLNKVMYKYTETKDLQ